MKAADKTAAAVEVALGAAEEADNRGNLVLRDKPDGSAELDALGGPVGRDKVAVGAGPEPNGLPHFPDGPQGMELVCHHPEAPVQVVPLQ